MKTKFKIFTSSFLIFFLLFASLVNFNKSRVTTRIGTTTEFNTLAFTETKTNEKSTGKTPDKDNISVEISGENCYNYFEDKAFWKQKKEQLNIDSLTPEKYQKFKTFFQKNQFEEEIVKEWNFFPRDVFNLEKSSEINFLEKDFETIKSELKNFTNENILILNSILIFDSFVVTKRNKTDVNCTSYLLKKEKDFDFIRKSFHKLFLLIDKKGEFSLSKNKSLNWANFLPEKNQNKFWYQSKAGKVLNSKYKFWYQLKTDKDLLVQKQVQELEKIFSLVNEPNSDLEKFFLNKFKEVFWEKWNYFWKKIVDFTKLKIGAKLYFDSKKEGFEFRFLIKKSYPDYQGKTWDQILSKYLDWETLITFINAQTIYFLLFFWPSFKEEVTFNDFKETVNSSFNLTLEKLLGKKFIAWKKTIFENKNQEINRIQKNKNKNGYKLLVLDGNDFFQVFYFKTEKQFNSIYAQKKISDIDFKTLIAVTNFTENLFKFKIRDEDEDLKLNAYKPKINLKFDQIKKTIKKIQNKSKKEDSKILKNIFIISGVAVFSLLMIIIFFKIFKKIKIKQKITVSEKTL